MEKKTDSPLRSIWKYISAFGWIVSLIASMIALAQVEYITVGNQALDQPFLECASFAFTDGFQLGTNLLPRSVLMTLMVGRNNPDFIVPLISKSSVYVRIPSSAPSIVATWRYTLNYRFTADVNNPLFGTLPLPTTNSTTFIIPTNGDVMLKWKFDIYDFTRQNLDSNITLSFDEFSEHYSAWTGGPFEVARSNHNSRQLNEALLVYSYSWISNATLQQQYVWSGYTQRARQASYAILGGITSMLSIDSSHAGWCGPPPTGADVWV